MIKTIKTFASCFNSFIRAQGRSLDFSSFSFPSIYVFRTTTHHIYEYVCHGRVFDCNQNWLIFMRFYVLFVHDHFWLLQISLALASSGIAVGYYHSIYIEKCEYEHVVSQNYSSKSRVVVISWLHCTLSWLSPCGLNFYFSLSHQLNICLFSFFFILVVII